MNIRIHFTGKLGRLSNTFIILESREQHFYHLTAKQYLPAFSKNHHSCKLLEFVNALKYERGKPKASRARTV